MANVSESHTMQRGVYAHGIITLLVMILSQPACGSALLVNHDLRTSKSPCRTGPLRGVAACPPGTGLASNDTQSCRELHSDGVLAVSAGIVDI